MFKQVDRKDACVIKSAGNGITATSHHFDKRQEGKSKGLFAFLTFSRKQESKKMLKESGRDVLKSE